MAFWGVEVKVGQSIKVKPGVESIIHLSLACLVDVKKDNKKDTVYLYVYTGNQKLCIGTLSGEKFPQIEYDLVFDKEFELSHTSKSGSVHLCGYRTNMSDSEINSEDIGVIATEEHKHDMALKPIGQLNDDSADSSDSDSSDKEDTPVAKKDSSEEDDSDDSSDSDSSDEDTPLAKKDYSEEDGSDDSSDSDSSDEDTPINIKDGNEENDSDDNSDSESSDEEDTPIALKASSEEDDSDDEDESNKELTLSNKRGNDPVHVSIPAKKAKFVTPPKTESKTSGGHVATPYPSKQLVKAAGNSGTSEFRCNPCNRTFGSDNALQSHSKAKHGLK